MTERFIGLYPCICPKNNKGSGGPGESPLSSRHYGGEQQRRNQRLCGMAADKRGESDVFGDGRMEEGNGPPAHCPEGRFLL